jgi:ketosteroid isomerase-like protein
MRPYSLIAAAGVLPFVIVSAVQSQTPANSTGDAAIIRAARTAQTQALAKDDVATVAKYWTPDITIRRALGQTVDGADAARKVIEPTGNTANRIVYQREAVSVEVSPNWPLAFEEGRWSGHPGSVDAKPIIGGRYSAQWVKRDGQWLIRSEVFVALTCADAGCKAAAVP